MKIILFLCIIVGILVTAKKQAWPIKTIALAFAGVGVVFGLFFFVGGGRKAVPSSLDTLLQPEKAAAYRFGDAIRAQLPDGGRILLVQVEWPDPEPWMQEEPATRAEGLQESLGTSYSVIRVNSLGREGAEFDVLAGTWILKVSDYAALIQEFGPADAVVTFSGLPPDLHNLPSLGLPFFGYIYDPLPEKWSRALPKGLSAVVAPVSNTLPFDSSRKYSISELAESTYTLTPALP